MNGTIPGIEIRPVRRDERLAASNAKSAALLAHPMSPETFAEGHASWDDTDSLGAWDGDRCVGHVGAYRFDVTIPGGARVPMAGITRAGILPTHTRRGLMREMMHRSLRESLERGQVIAGLRASEATIYRRFGFGIAGEIVAAEVLARHALPLRTATPTGASRILHPDEVFEVIPPLYERVARRRVGTVNREMWGWKRLLAETGRPSAEVYGDGRFVVVHTNRDGDDDGYAHYAVRWDQRFDGDSTGAGTVLELWGADDDVERALWRYLLEIDLVSTWRSDTRPLDDPIRRALTDTRAYLTRKRSDEQWVRLLDVDAALTARTYGPAAGDVTIEVHDPLFVHNSGRWTLTADGAARTDRRAETTVDIATLSAAYLGGVRWGELAAAGDLVASPEVLAGLDALFAISPLPFSGTFF
ncbi:MAG: GNAT family N-acetyltransferase [Acidimicrobiia bacterium]|nr:GNAT family N-acetyltransferase [Acidimicrobiia bacterium]